MDRRPRERLAQLTERLDHMVPDPSASAAENDLAARELARISQALAALLPDSSLSPDERLERLARVVQDRIPQQENLQSALYKVHKLKRRLDELVPDDNLSPVEKINRLEQLARDCTTQGKQGGSVTTAQETDKFEKILERLGDPRAGFDPIL